ncbi:MAG: hypothetical protein E7378_00620 [Clostridiales bacterium]|nr:hypothetical protein [Clostridiales bacterium]
MTELELFERLDHTITKRNQILQELFGVDFLNKMTSPENRQLYKMAVSNSDNIITECANQIAILLGYKKHFTKVTEVFKDEKITAWYTAKKTQKQKEC